MQRELGGATRHAPVGTTKKPRPAPDVVRVIIGICSLVLPTIHEKLRASSSSLTLSPPPPVTHAELRCGLVFLWHQGLGDSCSLLTPVLPAKRKNSNLKNDGQKIFFWSLAVEGGQLIPAMLTSHGRISPTRGRSRFIQTWIVSNTLFYSHARQYVLHERQSLKTFYAILQPKGCAT
jgi:hypothetical protein